MSDNNQLRLIAAEIVRKLWLANDVTQLDLLKRQIIVSLEQIEIANSSFTESNNA